MADSSLRSLERAAASAPEDAELAARLIAERLRAGGRDPRLAPRDDDVVEERQRRPAQAVSARAVLRTWPRVLTREVWRVLPATAEGGERGAEALREALQAGPLLVPGLPVPGARHLPAGTIVRRPRPGPRGWDEVQVQTAPATWAVYYVERDLLDYRTGLTSRIAPSVRRAVTSVTPDLALVLDLIDRGAVDAPPVEEVEWQSVYIGSLPDAEGLERVAPRRGAPGSWRPGGRVRRSWVHAWRDWCRDGRVVRVGA